jgi:hypothetical protein
MFGSGVRIMRAVRSKVKQIDNIAVEAIHVGEHVGSLDASEVDQRAEIVPQRAQRAAEQRRPLRDDAVDQPAHALALPRVEGGRSDGAVNRHHAGPPGSEPG